MPAIPYYSPIDLTKNELQNFLFHNLGSAPSSPGIGQVYFNTVDLKPYIWDGDSWNPFGEGTVTSVNVSGGTTGLIFSGGPVTSSGTITLSGTLGLTNGGTGASSAADARTNLGAVFTGTTLTFTTNNGLTGGGAAVDLSANRSFTFGLTGQALALHNLATNGYIVRTGAGTVAARTITAGTGISIANGDGVAGNTTITLSATLDDLTDVIISGATNTQVLQYNGTNWVNATIPLTNGTVTSVGLSLPSIFTVTNSPVTTSGTLTATLASQTANTVFSAPNGSAGAPTFRALVAADIPTLPITTKVSATAWRVFYSNGSGVITELALGTNGTYFRSGGVAAAPTFGTIAGSEVTGAALTATNDTNVTLTLGGTPATALLRAASITVGWTGTLAISRGGTGLSALGTANQLLRVNAGGTALEYFTSPFLTTAITSLNGLTAASQTFVNDTNITITSATSTHTIGWSGQLAVSRGGTGASTLTGIIIGNGTSAMTAVAGSANQMIRRNAGNTAYEFFTPGTANTIATLDSNGKVPTSQIPDSILGQVEYIGTWNALTNTPTLPNPTTVKGDYYVVTSGATVTGATYQDGSITFEVGDWVISNGSVWQKVDNTDAVTMVFGRIGAITAQAGDYNSFYVRHDTNAQGLNTTQQGNARTNINAQETITGAATTITSSNLTINRVLVSDGSGKVAVSTVTSTELGNLAGVTSNIQTQLNGKFNNPTGTTLQYLRGDGSLATFPVLTTLSELNTGTETAARLINALTINQWYDAKIFKQNIGNGVATDFNIDHNFGTKDVGVLLERVSDGLVVYTSFQKLTTNRVVVSFSTAPTTNQFRVIIVKY
jgi:hypothetical protein